MKRNRQSPPNLAAGNQQNINPPSTPASNTPTLSPGRRWLFRCFIALALPLLLLAGLEGILRLAGYGYPTTFFLRKQIHGTNTLVENPWFGLRFFPPALVRSPSAISVPAVKPAGTYRVFLFGESAALGDPRPAYGVGRYLETLLRDRYPGVDFEVVCAAMTAINSHALLPMAHECARYQGDLWIIYMGNNEFAGPFGANTVFGAQAPPQWAVRCYLALETTRVGQWLVSASRSLHLGRATPASWGGLKMFVHQQLPPNDPRRQRVYQNFRRNLDGILSAAAAARVPVILSSVASNLKDCPPFGSYSKPGGARLLPSTDLHPGSANTNSTEFLNYGTLAQTQFDQGHFSDAVRDYTKALESSPYSADTHFRLGTCFLAMTNFAAARQSFAQARDLDTLPFRTDTRLNTLIAEAAKRNKSKAVFYLDAEQALAPLSVSGIPGSEAFYEHVHLNWDGNYRLALAFAQQAAQCLPAAVTNRQVASWATPETCAAQLALTDWNRYTIVQEILRRLADPPFTGQFNHEARLSELTNELRSLRQTMDRPSLERARQVYQTALQEHPRDHWLHHNYAEFLTNIGDLAAATDQMRAVCDLLPDNHAGYFQLGRLLARQGKYDEARSALETSLRLRPDVYDVRVELGQVLAAQGKLDEALRQYAQAQESHGGDDARLLFLRAEVFNRQHNSAEAVASLQQAIRLRPDYSEAHELLGITFALGQQYSAAQSEFEQVIRLHPDYAEGHLNLGIALARQRHFGDALKEFQTTLRLDPHNQRAQNFVSTIHQMETQPTSP